jgi:transcriptional regulator with XRE-family HTH domain
MTFAQHLKNLMDERGWSKSDLARQLYGSYLNPKTGYWEARNRCNVGDWLSGKKYPKPWNLELLAQVFGITVAELTPPPSPPPSPPDIGPFLLAQLALHQAAILEILKLTRGLGEES